MVIKVKKKKNNLIFKESFNDVPNNTKTRLRKANTNMLDGTMQKRHHYIYSTFISPTGL